MKSMDKMTVRVDKHSNPHELVVRFDFSDLTDEQKLDLLGAAAKVRYASRLRKLGDRRLAEMAQREVTELDVTELFVRATPVQKPVDPKEVVKTCSDEVARQLLKDLQARLGQDEG